MQVSLVLSPPPLLFFIKSDVGNVNSMPYRSHAFKHRWRGAGRRLWSWWFMPWWGALWSWTEMSHGCMELARSLLPSPCLDRAASHGVFCPCLSRWISQVEDLGHFSCLDGLRLRCFIKIHMGQKKLPWIVAFIASGCPTHLWYFALYTLVIWNMTSVSPQQKHNMKRKR